MSNVTLETVQQTCKQRIKHEYTHEIARVRKLWNAYCKGIEDGNDTDTDDGTWNEYGLSFDYVAPHTFNGQSRGYFRYQVSTGGPADEWRIFCDENMNATRIEYWFMDWFDGAKIVLRGKAKELWMEIFADLREIGSVQFEYDKAMQE